MSDQEHLTVVEAEIVADGELDQGEEGISAPDASIVPAHPPGVGVDGDQVNVKTAASEAPQPLKSSESMPMSFPQKVRQLCVLCVGRTRYLFVLVLYRHLCFTLTN